MASHYVHTLDDIIQYILYLIGGEFSFFFLIWSHPAQR